MIKVGPLVIHIKRIEFLTLKNDCENQNIASFKAIFINEHWSAKDLLNKESVIYYSINLGFDAEVAEKFLNSI